MLIHKMRLDDNMAVLDVNSGAVHLVDDVIYDLLDYYDGTNDEEAVAALKERYSDEDLRDALAEMHELQENGLLFSPGFEVPPTFAEKPIVKSLCLLVTHDCNLRCGYCFDKRTLAQSSDCHNFFSIHADYGFNAFPFQRKFFPQ